MGAQNTKDRVNSTGSLSVRTTRNKPRVPKDGRQIGSNIFTEHSGMNHSIFFTYYLSHMLLVSGLLPAKWLNCNNLTTN